MQAEIYKINPFSLSKRIKRPLILDGAMGSLLQESGVPSKKKVWMTLANIDYPSEVLRIHKAYIEAGADIITTNTFRTNPAALSDLSDKTQLELLSSAVRLAKEARENLPVFIAGSNAPAEDCYQKQRDLPYNKLEYNHHKHISLLIDNGVNFILNETQSHFDEIKIICNYCSNNSIPYILSIYLDENLTLLSGENLPEVIQFVAEHDPIAIGLNCISPAQFNAIEKQFGYNWGFYLNCGSGNPEDTVIQCGFSPEDYLELVKDSLKYSPSFIGSCCGSNPLHIRKIKDYFDGKDRN
jgi:homocysteine S-methyltransferase